MLYLISISVIISLFVIAFSSTITVTNINTEICESLDVRINVQPMTTIYEGDIIDCDITGDPEIIYWQIENQGTHTTFFNDDPVIFDPEPTPLDKEYVNLSVHAIKNTAHVSDFIKIKIKRLFFGDIHFHSRISDGYHDVDTLYKNAIDDNYLDFACLTDHAEIINSIDITPFQPLWMRIQGIIQYLMYKFLGRDEWQITKNKANEYYNPGNFTTFLGFEYSSSAWYPGGSPLGPNGHFDTGHVNFYYKDVYPDANKYSSWRKYTFDDIFQAMNEEHKKGHLNVGFPHHPLMTMGIGGSVTINWSFLANNIDDTSARNTVLRGVETYSKWGCAIGKYSGIPISWPYDKAVCDDHPDFWVENALWEWSKKYDNSQKFVLMASSDNHAVDRPGSAYLESRFSKITPKPSGIIAAYSVHNTRDEIWDAMNNCSIYGTQALKIRANLRVNEEMILGQWINCPSPLQLRITAFSTFPGLDSSGKKMNPHGYSADELDYPISDIWIVKKDTNKGRPWCKIISHTQPNSDLAVIYFVDPEVKPNDFYYVIIKQKGQDLDGANTEYDTDEYMLFLGPVFINKVD